MDSNGEEEVPPAVPGASSRPRAMGLGVKALIFVSLCMFFYIYGLIYPVHWAIERDMPLAVRLLSESGFKDQKRPQLKGGCTTPLQLAAHDGSIKMVDILLDSGADIYFKGCTGGWLAADYGTNILEASAQHPGLIAHLIKDRGIDPNLTVGRQAEDMKQLRTSAEEGDRDAQWKIGLMYWDGSGGKKPDLVQAYMWCSLAGMYNVRLADLAATMTAEQIAEAKRLISSWNSKQVHPTDAHIPLQSTNH